MYFSTFILLLNFGIYDSEFKSVFKRKTIFNATLVEPLSTEVLNKLYKSLLIERLVRDSLDLRTYRVTNCVSKIDTAVMKRA